MNNVVLMKKFLIKHDSPSEELSSSVQETTSKESMEALNTELGATSSEQHLTDIQKLKRTELSEKYKAEYTSWRNMKQRAKTGAIIHPDFDDFGSFLRHVGPRPTANYTLDRIENENPTYGPGLVRWASKKTQNNNRSNTLHLVDRDGTTRTLTEWAEIKGIKPDTLRRRRRNGWTDHEVINGRELTPDRVLNITPWPKGEAKEWEGLYQQHRQEDRLLAGEDRIAFLKNISRGRLITAMEQLAELDNLACDYDLSEVGLEKNVKLLDEIIHCRENITHSERERRRQYQQNKQIARRPGDFSPEMEAKLRRQYGPSD